MVHDTKTHTPLKEHHQLVWYVKWISSIIIVLAMITPAIIIKNITIIVVTFVDLFIFYNFPYSAHDPS